MKKLAIIFYLILCGWFMLIYFGTRLTYIVKITDFGISTILLPFLLVGLFGYMRKWKYNDVLAFSVVMVCGFEQYNQHWGPMFFGTSPEKIRRYNEYFTGTLRIFPVNPNRVVPDVFHTVLGLLIAVCLILLLANIIVLFTRQFKIIVSA